MNLYFDPKPNEFCVLDTHRPGDGTDTSCTAADTSVKRSSGRKSKENKTQSECKTGFVY